MWEGTRQMAEAIGQGLAASGVPYKMFHMAISDRNDVITEVFKAKAIIVGSQNKIGAAFGSYGWSGESVKIIEEHLSNCKIQLVAEGVRAKWQPKPDDITKCKKLGHKVAQVINT